MEVYLGNPGESSLLGAKQIMGQLHPFGVKENGH